MRKAEIEEGIDRVDEGYRAEAIWAAECMFREYDDLPRGSRLWARKARDGGRVVFRRLNGVLSQGAPRRESGASALDYHRLSVNGHEGRGRIVAEE